MSMPKYGDQPCIRGPLGGPPTAVKPGLLDNYREALNEINNELIMSMASLQDNLGRVMGGYPEPLKENIGDKPIPTDSCSMLSNEIDKTRRVARRLNELINRLGEL